MPPTVAESDPPMATEDGYEAEQKLEEGSVFSERQDAASKLMSLLDVENTTNFDIEHNIRSIRAILTTNKEIWDRCRTFMVAANSDCSSLTFSIWGYAEIQVNQTGEELRFDTSAVKWKKSAIAEVLFILPSGLDILPPQYIETLGASTISAKIIDFESFFKRSLVLHDSILEPFLAKLKTHLEEVQVCLGDIDDWRMVIQHRTDFIECTFGKKLEVPPTMVVVKCDGSHQHRPTDICQFCRYYYQDHGGSSKVCPYDSSGVFMCKSPSCAILKTSRVTGTFQTSFTIANDHQQTQLLKFLDFVSTEE